MRLNYKYVRVNLLKLWQAKTFCDIILIASDAKTRIPAHRVVVAAFSPYFANQTVDAAGNIKPEIVVPTIDGPTLQRLVELCYSGTLEVDDNNMSNVYIGAVHLQLDSILTTMDNYIIKHLNISNCLHFYYLAKTLSRSMLLQTAQNYICAHFTEICDQPSFLELDSNKLKSLLALESLTVPSAEDLFQNVMKWIQHDPDGKRDDALSELFLNLRLSSMSPKFLLKHVKPHCKTVETNAFIFAALKTQQEFLSSAKVDVDRVMVPTVEFNREQLIVVTSSYPGTSKIMVYSFEQKKWNTLAELPTKIHDRSVTYSRALNSLCFVGGLDSNESEVNNVLLWNLKTRKFAEATAMMENRDSPSVTSLDNGDLFIVGRLSTVNQISTVERWSPEPVNRRILKCPKMGRSGARLIRIGNLIYCIGGTMLGGYMHSLECYNLTKRRWSTLAPLKQIRCVSAVINDGGKIYQISGYSDVIMCYDTAKNKWTEVCTMRGSRFITACVRHNNRVFAFGEGEVITSDGDWKIWQSDTIQATEQAVIGAFSIALQ